MTVLTPVTQAVSRPLSLDGKLQGVQRRFSFATEASLDDILRGSLVRSSELQSIKPGEVMEIHGPNYYRVFRLVSKANEFADLERIGSEDGPDPLAIVNVSIAPGEVFREVQLEGSALAALSAGRVTISSVNCDVEWSWQPVDDGLHIDIATASMHPVTFQVLAAS